VQRAYETQLAAPPAGSTFLPPSSPLPSPSRLPPTGSPEISKEAVRDFGNSAPSQWRFSGAVSISAHRCRESPSASAALVRALYYSVYGSSRRLCVRSCGTREPREPRKASFSAPIGSRTIRAKRERGQT